MPIVKKQIPDGLVATKLVVAVERVASALELIAGHLENANENSEQFARAATALENLVKEVNFAVTKV